MVAGIDPSVGGVNSGGIPPTSSPDPIDPRATLFAAARSPDPLVSGSARRTLDAQTGSRADTNALLDAHTHHVAAQTGSGTHPVTGVKHHVDRPIEVWSSVTHRHDGTTRSTVHIDVRANLTIDGGNLPPAKTAAARTHEINAKANEIKQHIEQDFSHTYRDTHGNTTRYVAHVDMKVGAPQTASREQFVIVHAGDQSLDHGRTGVLGQAPDFERGHAAYLSDKALVRTAPHEFGHLAGLHHTHDDSANPLHDLPREDLMTQTRYSESEHLTRSQLRSIFKDALFR